MTEDMATSIEDHAHLLAKLDTAELKEELAKSMRITGEHLLRMAAIVRILEDRGEDLRDIRYGIVGYLRRIACGQVLPEVVAKFQGAPMLLSRISHLPLPDQHRIVKCDSISVSAGVVDGEIQHRSVPLLAMSRDEIYQVFASDRVRDEAEQEAYLHGRGQSKRKQNQDGVVLDKKRGGIIVDGKFISVSDLAGYIARLSEK